MSRIPLSAIGPAADAQARELARMELALAAARVERKNRPTYLVVLASLLVVGAGVILVSALAMRARAESELRNVRGASQEFATGAARLRLVRAATGDKPSPVIDNNDRIRTRIQEAAVRAGMVGELAGMTAPSALLPTVTSDKAIPGSADGGFATQRSKFRYDNVRQPSLETLIRWLNTAVEDIPGLEVYSIHLKPEANGWNLVSVVFTRWERLAS